MNPFQDILKAFGDEHGVYVTMDAYPGRPAQIIMVRRNDAVFRNLEGQVDIQETMGEMYKELGDMVIDEREIRCEKT